jgi:PAS domain S-box-containing protein
MPIFSKRFNMLQTTGTVLLAAIWCLCGISISDASPPHTMLILNSYHQGEEWSDKEITGILSTLQKAHPFLVPAIEHLDAKRFPGPDHLLFMSQYLKTKYREHRPDLVFILDNPALDMMNRFRQELFPGVPIVFAGINGYTPGMIQGLEPIAGAAEVQDMAGTLQLALDIHPNTRSVLVIHDYTSSGLAVRKEMIPVAEKFRNQVEILYTPEETIDALISQLTSLPPNTLVLLLTYVTDKAGRTLTRGESTRLITDASPVPVYAMHETRMGHGIVGGMLLEGQEHGIQAAEIGLRILSQPADAPYRVENSRSRPVFDYRSLVRFNIPVSRLPVNSTVRYQPESFYQKYRALLIPGVIVAALLLTIIVILTVYVVRIQKARNAIMESEKNLKSFLDAIPETAFMMDPAGKVMIANKTTQERLDLHNTDMRNANIYDFIPEEVGRHRELQVAKVMETKQPISFEDQRTNRWIYNIITPILDKSGNVSRLTVIGLDITDRKQAEQALAESREQYRLFVETSNEGIWAMDADRRTTFVNRRMTGMLGYSTEEMLGQPVESFMFEEDMMDHQSQMASRKEGQGSEYERRFRGKDGREVWTRVSAAAIIDAHGRFAGSHALFTDITERKQAEKNRIRLEAQLQQAQKMEAIGSLAGGIAHDLNNILFPITGLSEMVMDDLPPGEPIRESIEQIHRSARRGSDLVKQILAFSRQSNPQKLPIRMQPILKESVNLIRATIPRNIEITRDIDPDCGMVSADPTQVHQIMMNLITNAFHAVEKTGGNIRVELKEVTLEDHDRKEPSPFPALPFGRYARISVADSGTGMDPSTISKIFEPYFTTKEQGKGTGLGLSVVHGIVKEYGGDIRVYSEIGKGSVFHIYLPLLEEDRKTGAAAIKNFPQGTERILLVDDEPPIIRMQQMMLERLGYRVTAYTSSLEAMEAFRTGFDQFDLVISDRGMPDMPGDRLANEMMSIRPDVPIILFSGFTTEMDEQQIKASGIKGFLMKPVEMGDMANMIRKVLDEAVGRPFPTPDESTNKDSPR